MNILSLTKFAALLTLLLFAAAWPLAAHAARAPKNILVLGDSLSAGYGMAAEQSWPSLLQEELKHQRLKFSVVNASISGETTVGGRQRIGRLLEQYRPAIVIVELGANDGLRGFSTADIESNLNEILLQAGQIHARSLLIGMKLSPNYGEPYITQFESMYPRLATKHGVALLPFLLEGIGAEQLQPDNLHPLAETQPAIMQKVLEALKPLLR